MRNRKNTPLVADKFKLLLVPQRGDVSKRLLQICLFRGLLGYCSDFSRMRKEIHVEKVTQRH
jgi:hypothetical protein